MTNPSDVFLVGSSSLAAMAGVASAAAGLLLWRATQENVDVAEAALPAPVLEARALKAPSGQIILFNGESSPRVYVHKIDGLLTLGESSDSSMKWPLMLHASSKPAVLRPGSNLRCSLTCVIPDGYKLARAEVLASNCGRRRRAEIHAVDINIDN